MMGATSEQGDVAGDNEKPIHQVTLSSFYIGESEVTQELWEAVMGSNPSKFKGAKKPVETVSWNDCQEFINKLNQITHCDFRLPTEAEWEYAARGGKQSKGFIYSGSENAKDVAWVEGFNYERAVHEVGIKKPNELGVYDMSGNIREWCYDWFDDMYYKHSKWDNPLGPITGEKRVCRGGCTLDSFFELRVSSRLGCDPNYRGMIGIRLACSKLKL